MGVINRVMVVISTSFVKRTRETSHMACVCYFIDTCKGCSGTTGRRISAIRPIKTSMAFLLRSATNIRKTAQAELPNLRLEYTHSIPPPRHKYSPAA